MLTSTHTRDIKNKILITINRSLDSEKLNSGAFAWNFVLMYKILSYENLVS